MLLREDKQTTIATNRALGQIGALVSSTAKSYFGNGPPSPRWKKLAEPTIVEKARLGYGGKGTLIRTTNLRDSITYSPKSPKRLYVMIGTNVQDKRGVDYARIHEQLEFGGGTIPARPFLQPARDLTTKEQMKLIEKNLLGVPLIEKRGVMK